MSQVKYGQDYVKVKGSVTLILQHGTKSIQAWSYMQVTTEVLASATPGLGLGAPSKGFPLT